METFSALLALCAGNSSVTVEFPPQRPVTQSFDVFFDLRLNKRLSKQSWRRWFDTLSRSLWRHCALHWVLLIYTDWATSLRWVRMSWHRTSSRPSASSTMSRIWLYCSYWVTPIPHLPTKTYTTLVPKFEKYPLFADSGGEKHPFSTGIADFEAQ